MSERSGQGGMISVVVPCYNEEEALPHFLPKILETADTIKERYGVGFELLLVDDGSRDGTLKLLRRAAEQDSRVRYLSFSRNFGKEAAIYAGLEWSKGTMVAVMDADLQDPPELLPQMYETLRDEDYDCVATCRADRKGEPVLRSFFARCFYKIINRISDADIVDGARDFRLMRRKMADAIVAMGEYNRFSKGIFGWVGFRTKWLPYKNVERAAGKTKWSFWALFKYSIQGIVAFSTAPLVLSSMMGLLFCAVAFGMVLWILIKTIAYGDPVGGWPSLATMIMFMGGIQLFCMGILGQYLAKMYLETKRRPIYILAESDESQE